VLLGLLDFHPWAEPRARSSEVTDFGRRFVNV
jgi:hypothetical protein